MEPTPTEPIGPPGARESPRYRIHHVARLTGVHPSTLRAWERRYGLIQPQRTPAGHRLYSEVEIARVRTVARLATEGIPYGHIAEILEREGLPAAGMAATVGADLVLALRERTESAARGFDGGGLESAYTQSLGTFCFEDTFERVFLPVLAALGDRWHAGEDIVAEEHFLSAFIHRKLQTHVNSLPATTGRFRVVCASAPGEEHELGLLFLALKLVGRGVPVVYLGRCTPAPSLMRAAFARGVGAVCLSTTLRAPAGDLSEIKELVQRLRSRPDAPAVLVGGQGSVALNGNGIGVAAVFGTDAEAGLAHALSLAGAV
ncbi:MAG: MerR family transcriptional regulator [Gemmatimonadetes bacterium]|nr:MerR family transcriptional regulator [Gemmatimonadota bacterium]